MNCEVTNTVNLQIKYNVTIGVNLAINFVKFQKLTKYRNLFL